MQKKSEKILVVILLSSLLIFFVVIALLSDGVYGGADNYSHFRLARYAFRHPEFFVDQWGKPVYTTLTSIFAQYGFNGSKVFNILAGLATAYILFLSARKLNYRYPILIIIILCSMPLYFLLMISSLTEVLFSLLVAFSTWLFLTKKYKWFAVVASFIPFVRTEGFILLPVYVAALVTEKKFKALPMLLTGTVFYSIVGSFHYGDLFWVFNQMPYVGGKNVYGSGSLLHYVNANKEITGLLPAFLLVAGIAILIYQSFSKAVQNNFLKFEWMLLFLPFFIYLSFHSWLWWQGLGASFGLIRVMAGVLPLAALLCMKPLTLLFDKLPSNIFVRLVPMLALLFLLAREPFRANRIPIPLSGPSSIVKEASEWLLNNKYAEKKIYYYNPEFCFFLDINPFDLTRIQQTVPDREHPESGISEGEIVLWDAHFSPNEGQFPLHRIMDNPYFTLVKTFEPAQPFKVLGGYDYAIHVFKRNDKKPN